MSQVEEMYKLRNNAQKATIAGTVVYIGGSAIYNGLSLNGVFGAIVAWGSLFATLGLLGYATFKGIRYMRYKNRVNKLHVA